MPRKILVFFMSMVLLGGYGIGVYRAQADSDLDQYLVYVLQGTVFVDNVALTPTANSEHMQYVLVPLVRKVSNGIAWTELTARKYQMGSDVDAGDNFLLLIQDDDKVDGVPIGQGGPNFEMKIQIYLLGDESTKYDVMITPPPGESWYVGKGTSPGGIYAQADVYASIPPGQPQNLQAAATVGSEIRSINLQWTAPGADDGLGTVTGYLAKVSTAPITGEPEWNAATLLNTTWLTPPLKGPGQTENRTATVDPPAAALDPNLPHYVALRAVDAAGTQGPFASAQANMPPTATSVSISPPNPKTTDNLVLNPYTYSDPEGDPESGTLIRWYKNGVHQPAYNNQNPLPSSATKKGDTWKASVQPANAKGMGLEVESNTLTVINTPPVANPNGPYSSKIDSGGNTVLPITFNGTGSSDADGDPLTYEWSFGDGTTGTGPTPTHTYPAILILYPRTFPVTLRVHDGEAYSSTVGTTATVTINKKPVADAGGPYEGIAGEPLAFDGSGSDDPDNDEDISDLLFKWDFDNDGNVDYESPTRGVSSAAHTYPTHGTYTASLKVRDYLEDSLPDTASVLVRARPVADFTWLPDPQNEGLPVDFTDASTDADGTIVSWVWDFGDGFGDVGPNPSHTYTDNGDYTVELTVTDNDGLTDTEQHVVTVNNVAPDVEAGEDQSVNEGDTVSISGTFTDPGSSDTHIATINWGDGSPVDTIDPAASPVTGSHVYADNGVFTVTLTVTDDDGGIGVDTLTVTVSNVAPTVEAGADQSVVEGDTVSISGTFTDPGIGDTHIATIDWGDGTAVDTVDPATSPVPGSHVYADNGVYIVELTVTDDDGGQGSDTLTVNVSNADPIVEAGADQSVDEGDTVSISGTFTDPGSGDTHTATIDWGDGSLVDNIDPATSPVPGSHVYVDEGVYTVTLTVEDDETGVGTDTLTVTVSNAPPVVEAGADQSANEGDTVPISGTFTDPGSLDTHTATINWGDGSPVDNIDPATSPVPSTHVYEDNGVYTVTLTVTDNDAGIGADTLTVSVSNVDPVVEAGADQSVDEGDTVSISGTFTDVSAVDTHTATIDWGDGSPVDTVDPATSPVAGSHVYADNGTYTVTLAVTDDDGGIGTDTLTVTVSNVAPTAEAGADQAVNEGDTVSFAGSFTDPGSGDTHTIEWAFGDSSTASGSLTPTHVYADNGVYTVTLTVTDDDTGVDTDTLTVTVSNVAPTVNAGADQSVNEGDTVSFAGSFSDPGTGDTHTIEWDFGDSSTASGSLTPTHVYADNGVYTVTLTVTDDDTGVGTDTLTVTVSNVAPVVDAGADQSVNEGDTVSFAGSFTDPGTGDTHTIEWAFGDSSTASGSLTPTHVYVDDGVYTVTLTVTDDDTGVGTDTLTVTVNNAPPVVEAGPDQSVDEGDTVSFSGSFTDAGTSDTHTIHWDFGDSNTASGSLTPTHVYADNGVYTVTLTVTDNDTGVGTDTLTVTVSNVAPVVDAGPGDLEVSVRQPVNITVEFSDQGSGDTHTATVNWGDGTPVDNIDPAISPMSASHIYVIAGEFNVAVTITDDDGGTVTHSMKITVKGIKVLAVTFNVLEQTLIVELDEPVDPGQTQFGLIGMEISDSGKWDLQLPPDKLPIMEQGPSNILHIDMKRNLVAAPSLTRAGLVKFLPVDFLAEFGAFGDAAGSLSIEVTGADNMRITMVANGFILGTLADVTGNGQVTALDAAFIAKAATEGTGVFPIATTMKQIDALLPGVNTAKAAADVNKDGKIGADDAFLGLRLAAGYDTETAPPNMASDTRKCRLSVNNYDSGNLDVSLDVEDVSGVYCADIVVSYDPSTLTVADVSGTSSISDWVFADAAESGKLRIAMAGLSQPAANGSLVNLSIHAASADAIKELQIVEFRLNGGRARAEVENLPKAFALMPNYPNPFNPETWIPYQITVPANVTISIYNLNGQIVRRLELGTRMPGSYVNRSRAAYWDGRNESGEMVSSGIYFYQLQAGRDAAVRKMVIVK